MFFALDTLGTESLRAIRTLPTGEKWNYVYRLAASAGFSALLLTQTLYDKTLSMPLEAMSEPPAGLQLLLFLDAPYTLLSPADGDALVGALEGTLALAEDKGITDVYLPPPTLPGGMQPLRGFIREAFGEALRAVLPKYRWDDVRLSVESRLPGSVFQGLLDFAHFIDETERLGALLDIAELCYDGYSEKELHEVSRTLRVAGLRIGDADPGLPREAGIGLPIGQGTIALRRLLLPYAEQPIAGILTVRAPFEAIGESLARVKGYVGAG